MTCKKCKTTPGSDIDNWRLTDDGWVCPGCYSSEKKEGRKLDAINKNEHT